MSTRTFSLLVGLLALGAALACRERRDRSGSAGQPAPPDSSRQESTMRSRHATAGPRRPIAVPHRPRHHATQGHTGRWPRALVRLGSAADHRRFHRAVPPGDPTGRAGPPLPEAALRVDGDLRWDSGGDGRRPGGRRHGHGVRQRFFGSGDREPRGAVGSPRVRGRRRASAWDRRSGRCSGCTAHHSHRSPTAS